MRNIAELDRLRKMLVTKRDRFKFKLDSVSSVPHAMPKFVHWSDNPHYTASHRV